jgi:two-component system nitrate/nitrite response regulator NarL
VDAEPYFDFTSSFGHTNPSRGGAGKLRSVVERADRAELNARTAARISHDKVSKSTLTTSEVDHEERQVYVTVSVTNELQRYGLERMLAPLGVMKDPPLRTPPSAEITGVCKKHLEVVIFSLAELGAKVKYVFGEIDESCRKIIVLLDSADPYQVSRAADIRCHGYIDIQGLSTAIIGDALEKVSRGDVPIPKRLADGLLTMARNRTGRGVPKTLDRLTLREKEVLFLLVEGLANKQIARQLSISQHGVKRLVGSVLAKLNSPNRTLAAVRALEMGLHPDTRG